MKRKIIVADDHPIVRQGLIQMIAQEPDLSVVGEASDAAQALKLIAERKPDLAIVDLSFKEGNGLDLIKEIAAMYPRVRVLVVSLHDERLYAERSLRAGARGYVMKTEATDDMMFAVREVLAGRVYLSPAFSSELLAAYTSSPAGGTPRRGQELFPAIDSLSDRELEVFQLIGLGRGTSTIAKALNLSVKTVETYRSHLKRKLNLRDSAELVQYAVKFQIRGGG